MCSQKKDVHGMESKRKPIKNSEIVLLWKMLKAQHIWIV